MSNTSPSAKSPKNAPGRQAALPPVPQGRVRNFSIIAHADHGKSTLADRMMELSGALAPHQMKDRVLDSLELEQERGITIKAQTVSLHWKAQDGHSYRLNLIDTPGHVDFSYEVSRSLAACEGALLLVDASQGVEAQTLANLYLALQQDLSIIAVLSKVDLPHADAEGVERQLREILGGQQEAPMLQVNSKTGEGVSAVLEELVQQVPSPTGDMEAPLQALVYDAWFDSYLGVMVNIRLRQGRVQVGDRIMLMKSGKEFEVSSLGMLTPQRREVHALSAGDVGNLAASIKNIQHARVGDTLTLAKHPAAQPLPGYTRLKPMVFSGLYPAEGELFEHLREALGKLALNDAALEYEPETSTALGYGFRCKFLGMLHLEIIQQRLEREMGIHLIATAPTVVYQAHLKSGEVVRVENPNHLPETTRLEHIAEPYVRGQVFVPKDYVGRVMQLLLEKRGQQQSMEYLERGRAVLTYDLPLNEVIVDFHDRLKSATRGYGSFDYEQLGFRQSELVKLDLLLNGSAVDALSLIVPKSQATTRGRELALRLKQHIPRQMFEVAIQAAVGSRIVARESIRAVRKNVTAKCYGGDISRKRKLLEKQKEGKRRMKQIGSVEVPQDAFMTILKTDN